MQKKYSKFKINCNNLNVRLLSIKALYVDIFNQNIDVAQQYGS